MQNPSYWKIAEQPVESREKLRIKRQNRLFALLSPSSAPHSYANYKRTNRSSDPILSCSRRLEEDHPYLIVDAHFRARCSGRDAAGRAGKKQRSINERCAESIARQRVSRTGALSYAFDLNENSN